VENRFLNFQVKLRSAGDLDGWFRQELGIVAIRVRQSAGASFLWIT
jgi:hypothetical protein